MNGGETGAVPGGKAGALLIAAGAVVLVIEAVRAPQVNLDLAPLYGAAVLLTEGRMEEAYEVDPRDLRMAGPALTAAARDRGYPVGYVLRFLHPPAVAAMVAPFTALDFPAAAILWRILALIAIACAAIVLARMAGGGLAHAAIAVICLLVYDPFRMTLDLGQTGGFVLLLVAIGFSSRPGARAGLALAVAALLKTFVLAIPVLWLAPAAADGRRKATLAALGALAVVHCAAYLASPEGTFAYADMVRGLGEVQFLWPDQQSVASQVTRVETGFGEADVAGWSDRAAPAGLGGVVAPVWAAIMVVSAFTLAWRKRPEPMSVGVLGLCAGLVASPVLHTHYTLMLAVPVAWIARRGLLDAAAWMVAAGVALAALPMHQAEAAYWFRYLPGIGLYWLFVTHGLAAVMLATAGVAIGVIRDSGGITSTTRQ